MPATGDEFSVKLVFVGLTVFYTVTVIGLYRRTSWGRVFGIIACIIP